MILFIALFYICIPLVKSAENGKIRVTCVGDSITDGIGASDGKLNIVKNKNKTNTNVKAKKHSKVPKKKPVVNINIDLKDLIKQENMEKYLGNSKKIQSKSKKTKECFDYPDDLKYNVFGKQYKFSYNN